MKTAFATNYKANIFAAIDTVRDSVTGQQTALDALTQLLDYITLTRPGILAHMTALND